MRSTRRIAQHASTRRIAQHAAIRISITILTVFAPGILVAQQAPGVDGRSPVSLTVSSIAHLRFGISAKESRDGGRALSLTTTSPTYSPYRNYSVGLDSAAAGRMRRRLTHTAIGAVSGVVIGTAIGALVAARPAEQDCHDLCSNRGVGIVYVGAIGLVAGAVIGAVRPIH